MAASAAAAADASAASAMPPPESELTALGAASTSLDPALSLRMAGAVRLFEQEHKTDDAIAAMESVLKEG